MDLYINCEWIITNYIVLHIGTIHILRERKESRLARQPSQLQYIQTRLCILPKVEWRWVESHLDKIGKILDWWAFQNQKIYLDSKALLQKCKQTTSLQNRQEFPIRSPISPTYIILLYWGNHYDNKFDPHSTFDWEVSWLAMAKLPQHSTCSSA